MWKTGRIAGYRWEAVVNNNAVVKIAVHKAGETIVPNKFLEMLIKISVTLY